MTTTTTDKRCGTCVKTLKTMGYRCHIGFQLPDVMPIAFRLDDDGSDAANGICLISRPTTPNAGSDCPCWVEKGK